MLIRSSTTCERMVGWWRQLHPLHKYPAMMRARLWWCIGTLHTPNRHPPPARPSRPPLHPLQVGRGRRCRSLPGQLHAWRCFCPYLPVAQQLALEPGVVLEVAEQVAAGAPQEAPQHEGARRQERDLGDGAHLLHRGRECGQGRSGPGSTAEALLGIDVAFAGLQGHRGAVGCWRCCVR